MPRRDVVSDPPSDTRFLPLPGALALTTRADPSRTRRVDGSAIPTIYSRSAPIQSIPRSLLLQQSTYEL